MAGVEFSVRCRWSNGLGVRCQRRIASLYPEAIIGSTSSVKRSDEAVYVAAKHAQAEFGAKFGIRGG